MDYTKYLRRAYVYAGEQVALNHFTVADQYKYLFGAFDALTAMAHENEDAGSPAYVELANLGMEYGLM